MNQMVLEKKMQKYGVVGLSLATIDGEKSEVICCGKKREEVAELIKEETLFNACSISKFVTAFLTVKLAHEKKVDLDKDLKDELFQTGFINSGHPVQHNMTLRQLLRHQAGVHDPEHSFSPLSTAHFPTMEEVLIGQTSYMKENLLIQSKANQFAYTDAGYCLIQYVLEKTTGQTFERLMDEHIFQPLNMTNSTFNWQEILTVPKLATYGHHKSGKVYLKEETIYPFHAASGLWSTSTDLAKLMMEWNQTLQGRSRLGISVHTLNELLQTTEEHPYAGLGLFLDRENEQLEISSLGWGVGFQSMLIYYPSLEKGFVIMTNTDLGVHQTKGLIGDIYQSFKHNIG
ncbi:serine hydrolase domain-containing protein [Alkalihalobacillus sp. 1P02AB]|uniref:serine hydrolase domain-containing protein n=1 Tax=Alkalihalobacillus sp. 1P02AB TaxID=3132260 RepID=UPI0039A66CCF